jgi:hypothetical protein
MSALRRTARRTTQSTLSTQSFRRVVSARFARSAVYVVLGTVATVCGLQAADRAEITFDGPRIFPESLTSTKNGDVYFGSLGQDSVYRATSKDSQAKTWIQPKSNGLMTVLGVFADEKAGAEGVQSQRRVAQSQLPVPWKRPL